MDNIVSSILINDKFGGIAREVKKTPQEKDIKATLSILSEVAKFEGMDRLEKQIAIYQKSLAS
jgi:hypothetical protein